MALRGLQMQQPSSRRWSVITLVTLSLLVFSGPHSARADSSRLFSLETTLPTFTPAENGAGFDFSKSAVLSVDESVRRILAGSGGYISYGALTARNVPCRPRSGRSYYTPNCRSASGPVRPYQRGCTAIARCARG